MEKLNKHKIEDLTNIQGGKYKLVREGKFECGTYKIYRKVFLGIVYGDDVVVGDGDPAPMVVSGDGSYELVGEFSSAQAIS
jgi:hypothetical protein